MRLSLLQFIICTSLFFFAEASVAKGSILIPKTEASIQSQIDSLNLTAIKTKRTDLKHSFALLSKAGVLAEEHNYTSGLATNYLYKAEIYEQYGYKHKSLELYHKTLEISSAAGDSLNIARAKDKIGYSLIDMGDHTQGKKYLMEAMIGYKALGMHEKMVNLTNKIGLIELSENNFETAKKYFDKARIISQKHNYWYGEKKANFDLGLLFLKANDLKQAKAYFLLALKMDTEKGDTYGLSLAKNKLSYIAILEGDFKTAIQLAASALQDAREISVPRLEKDALQNLIIANDTSGNIHEVAQWQKKLISIQRQEDTKEDDQLFIFMKLMEEEEQRRLQLIEEALKAKQQATLTNTILAISIICTCLLSFLSFMWFHNYKMARKYNAELKDTNLEIENHAKKQDKLNQTISHQNKILEENNQMKDKLFSIVSHDLRSPLASLKGFISLMERKSVPAEKVSHLMSLLSNEVDVVLEMLTNLLQWSRTQLSNAEVSIAPVNLHDLVEENFKLLASQAGKKNISLKNSVSAESLAMADKERLNFVVRNLVANAIKFTYEGGSVDVYVAGKDDTTITLAVSDDGKGMSPDNLNKLFKGGKGFTTPGTAKEKGTGLGLNLSYDFIKSINGNLDVQSVEGEGSTFNITLPNAITSTVGENKELAEIS